MATNDIKVSGDKVFMENAAGEDFFVGVTPNAEGLGLLDEVDNTSDADKPISTATQTALDDKAEGPESSTDNAIPRFNGTGGATLQDSTTTIDDSGNVDVAGTITATKATGAKFSVVGNTASGADADIPSFELINDNTSGYVIGKFKIGTGYLGGKGEVWLMALPAELALRGVSNHPLHIWTNNARQLTVLANGNVGIGDTTPSEKLVVNGTIKATDINFTGLPTSATGLSTGDVWNESGTLRIV